MTEELKTVPRYHKRESLMMSLVSPKMASSVNYKQKVWHRLLSVLIKPPYMELCPLDI